jgi:predicted RNA-binding protein with PIN domain
LSGPQRVIIDGYNVIYTDDRLRRVAIKDIERAREHFVRQVKSYLASRQLRVTIVFDGRGGLTDAESVIPGKLQVLYSPTGQTADEVIVGMVTRSGNPRQFIVVTSDQADIGSRLRPLGSRIIRSKRFLERMAATQREEREDEADPGKEVFGDTDYWLRRFEEDEDGKHE